MNLKEAELVTEEFCSRKDTYNLCPGGKGGWGYVNQNGLAGRVPLEDYLKRGPNSRKAYVKHFHEDEAFRRDTLNRLHSALKKKYPKGVWKGKAHHEETKLHMSLIMREKQAGTKNSQYGTRWMTDGVRPIKVKEHLVSEYLSKGYRFGR